MFKGKKTSPSINYRERAAAWFVHLFTASGAVLGLFSLYAIHRGHYLTAFWLMGATVFIDAVDGVMSRKFRVEALVPNVDGCLLDNLVDYLNYVVVPAFFLLTGPLLPEAWRGLCAAVVVVASAYQFTQRDAKTEDHFFKGFPSYWNLVVFYLFLWQTAPWANWMIILFLAAMVVVPVKYVYPSRPDCLTRSRWWRGFILGVTGLYGLATLGLLWIYPRTSTLLVLFSVAYIVFYVALSLYRTFKPFPASIGCRSPLSDTCPKEQPPAFSPTKEP